MTESKLQTLCYTWFHNTYPDHRGLLCYNLNNSKNRIDGARNRAMGLQPGRSDMVLYHQGRSIMIEIKTVNGNQTTKQKQWQQLIEDHDFEYVVIRSLESFQQLIHKVII